MAEAEKGVIPGVIIFVGIMGLSHVMRQPRFDQIRPVDFLQILGSGVCFGIGIMQLIERYQAKRDEIRLP